MKTDVLTFENKEKNQKITITIKSDGEKMDIENIFSPDVEYQDKDSWHYITARIIISIFMRCEGKEIEI